MKKGWLLVSILHWILSFFTDSWVVTCENTFTYGVWKAVFLVFVVGFYQLAGFVVQRYRSGDEKVRKICILSGIYFLVMMVFLLLTWPGIWRIDEFTILKTAKDLHIHYWQGYLTSIYYILCLMLIPTPASVILWMCVINSFIVGYLVYTLWMYTGQKKIAFLLYLPFLFFPVIDSNLYPMRMSIYAFAELLLLAKVCFWKYENRIPEKKELSLVLLLAGIVTSWRTESIYYLVLFPVLLAFLFWKKLSKQKLVKIAVAYLVIAVAMVGVQKIGEGTERGDNYELTAIIRPLTPLIVEAAFCEEKDLIAAVDKVVNCAYLFEGASKGENGIGIFWEYTGNGLLKDNYTREDYQNYKKAYYELILRHPKVFLKERLDTYLQSTSLLGRITDVEPPSEAIHAELRKKVYSILELRSFEDYFTQGIGATVVYSSVLPSIFLALGSVLLLLKKQFVYAGSALMVFAKVPLVFLTAPGTLFMYYYSPYLCGWIFLIFAAILLFVQKGSKKEC